MIKAAPGSERLKSFVTRIEKLEEEQKAIGGDKCDVYTELKAAGYNPKAVRKIIQQRRAKPDAELQADIETYQHALGMAAEAASNGDMSLRKAAEKFGVSKSAVHRAVPREEKPARGTPHDTKTGEITEAATSGDDAGHRSEPSIPAEQSVEPAPPSGRVSPGIDAGKGSNPAPISERPHAQEVGASDARPEGAPIDLTIPESLRRTA